MYKSEELSMAARAKNKSDDVISLTEELPTKDSTHQSKECSSAPPVFNFQSFLLPNA